MGNRGYAFEKELTELYEKWFGKFVAKNYRIFGSGRNKGSTISGGERKKGDNFLILKSKFLRWNIRFTSECKWYSPKGKTVKSVAIQKSWLDQARQEAYDQNSLAAFVIKFKGQNKNSKDLKDYYFHRKDANSVWIAMPAKHFFLLILYLLGARLGVDLRGEIEESEEVEKAISKRSKRR